MELASGLRIDLSDALGRQVEPTADDRALLAEVVDAEVDLAVALTEVPIGEASEDQLLLQGDGLGLGVGELINELVRQGVAVLVRTVK
jgi:hypothetical protein